MQNEAKTEHGCKKGIRPDILLQKVAAMNRVQRKKSGHLCGILIAIVVAVHVAVVHCFCCS